MMYRLDLVRLSTRDEKVIETGDLSGSGIFMYKSLPSRMVRVFPTAGWPTIITYIFGNNGREVLIQTFCSKAAAIVDIAVQRRKISGACRLSVWSMKDFIHDVNLRLPASVVMPSPIPQSVGVFIRVVFAFVPPGLAVVGDAEGAVVEE